MQYTNSPEYRYMSNAKNKMQIAMSTSNSAVLSVAKSILDEAGIIFAITENGKGTEIQVAGDDLFKVSKLLHELEELDFEKTD